jgi:hypothetical protein
MRRFFPLDLILTGVAASLELYSVSDSRREKLELRINSTELFVGAVLLLAFITLCFVGHRRNWRRNVATPTFFRRNDKTSTLPYWQGTQSYGPPRGPLPGQTPGNYPYQYNPQSAPPPYVKEGEGMTAPQDSHYAPVRLIFMLRGNA